VLFATKISYVWLANQSVLGYKAKRSIVLFTKKSVTKLAVKFARPGRGTKAAHLDRKASAETRSRQYTKLDILQKKDLRSSLGTKVAHLDRKASAEKEPSVISKIHAEKQ
jgi:hypothetical protein